MESKNRIGVSPVLSEILHPHNIDTNQLKWLAPESIPAPYRGLLFHKKDMTSTLEGYHCDKIRIDAIRVRNEENHYSREVVLKTINGNKPVEYGAIDFCLNQFPDQVSQKIQEANKPLGGILNESEMSYTSRPIGYFSVDASKLSKELFSCDQGTRLYGRYNQLFNEANEVLASMIEILPFDKSQ